MEGAHLRQGNIRRRRVKPDEEGGSLTGQAAMGSSVILVQAWSGWLCGVQDRGKDID